MTPTALSSTPEAAIRALQPGTRILLGSGAAEPSSVAEALVGECGQHLRDNEIVHLLTLGPAPYVRPEFAERFRHRAFFIGGNVRDAVRRGQADFMPIFLSEIPQWIRSERGQVDAAIIQVSPPDRHGFVSLGVSVDIVRAAVDTAKVIIAEVNPQMPRTHGNSFLPVESIDHLIEVDHPLPELPRRPLNDTMRQIGAYTAEHIDDGATLQLGIGAIPDAVLASLSTGRRRRDLGIHTEMFSDGVMELVQAGVITGRKKTIHTGKLVTSFVMGSQALYEWVHDNPMVSMQDSAYTNAPRTIAKHAGMVSINSALAVDLTGQVAADSIGSTLFSGIGGQVDFVRGAVASDGGKSIIALPSTAKNGTISRIQAQLAPGSGVVTSRGDVHTVVTEYGSAELWGRSTRERAESLISIAHPSHRDELAREARTTLGLRVRLG